MKQIIVQISGKQGSGKTSVADALAIRLAKCSSVAFVTLSYAYPLYKMAKNLQFLALEYGLPVPVEADGKPLKDGDLLQLIGTWGRKNFGMDVWVNVMRNRIEQHHIGYKGVGYKSFVSIISDCRFPNEAALGGSVYRLECPESIRKERILATPGQSWRENTLHESEVALDNYPDFRQVYWADKASVEEITDDIFNKTIEDINAKAT